MSAIGSLALVRARRLAKAADIACALSVEALQGSRVSFRPEIQALRPLPGQAASAANLLRLVDGSAIIESHRWCDKVQDAYSLRCAPQVHGACRDLLDYAERTIAVELNAATDNPLVFVETRRARLERELPRSAARLRARRGGDGARRVREHLRAARRAAHEPVAFGRAAGVPDARRRPELGLHDPAVRRGGARQREQGALPSGERRLDPDERRPGGSRLDGKRVRSRRAGRCWRTASGRSRSSSSPRRRGSSSSRRSSPVPGRGPRTTSSARSRRPCWKTGRSRPTSSCVAEAIRTGSSSSAVEDEIGPLA